MLARGCGTSEAWAGGRKRRKQLAQKHLRAPRGTGRDADHAFREGMPRVRARCPARPSRRQRRADGAAPCLREEFEPWPTRRARRRPFRPLGHAQSGRGRAPATLAEAPAATAQGEAPAGGTADQWPMRRTWNCQRSSRLTGFPDASARSHTYTYTYIYIYIHMYICIYFAEPRGWVPAGRSGAASSGPGGSVGGYSQAWEDSISRRESSRQRSQCDTSARSLGETSGHAQSFKRGRSAAEHVGVRPCPGTCNRARKPSARSGTYIRMHVVSAARLVEAELSTNSYLLGLLAMIKCSICSYQCDN